MATQYLTIKGLTNAVGGKITPRMVRHYHQCGLMPQPERSDGNYRLYADKDVQRLKRIVSLKQQGFQLSHIHQLLDSGDEPERTQLLMVQFQQQYQSVIRQIAHLRHTATALERLLGRDRDCQIVQAEAIAQLKLLEVETQSELGNLERFWKGLDTNVINHPEAFQESLQQLLPDLSDRSEIEIDLLSKLVLACGDLSLIPFIRLSVDAIASARNALKARCQIVTDVNIISNALDCTRLNHLGCSIETLIDDPHINTASEAEQSFCQEVTWQERLKQLPVGCVIVIGYAPSVLLAVCEAIAKQTLHPALVIGMPIGFSHAPLAKRSLLQLNIPYITIDSTIGGGLLAATALNSLVESLLEKPDCHCYLSLPVRG